MRIIDVHCYPNTREWIACQQPYVDALAAYWNRPWVPKEEKEVVQEFTAAGRRKKKKSSRNSRPQV